MEIRLEMLFRFLVTLIPNPQTHDVLLHVLADVCRLLTIPPKLNRQFQQLCLQFRHLFSQSTHQNWLCANQNRLCAFDAPNFSSTSRSEEHTSELQSHSDLVCRLLLEKKNKPII